MTGEGKDQSSCDPGGGLLRDGLSAVGLELATAGFAALWNGRALRPDELIPNHAKAAAEVTTALLKRGRAEVDDDGRLVGIHGLSVRITRHHFVHNGRAHYTWCAFDAIGIPAALGIDADVHTDCPTCNRPLQIEIREGRRESRDGLALWLPATTGEHLMIDFCANADMYCSLDHLERRIDTAASAGQVTDLEDAASLGRETWADVTGISLDTANGAC
jgi:alkylmercury lyase